MKCRICGKEFERESIMKDGIEFQADGSVIDRKSGKEVALEEKEAVIEPDSEIQGKKKAIKTKEEDLAAQEEHSKAFVKKALEDIGKCETKAALNVLKASVKFIEGRAKCLKEYKDYIDAVLKTRYEKLEGK